MDGRQRGVGDPLDRSSRPVSLSAGTQPPSLRRAGAITARIAPDADCNVSYYGVALDEHLGEIDRIQKPLLMHVAALDKFVPAEARAKIVAALSPRPGVELHVYEGADHAFARQGGEHYDADAAKTANDRTAAFLARHLAG